MPNSRKIKRGDIFHITAAHEAVGSCYNGDRPAIVVSNNKANLYSPAIEVVYLTTARKRPMPTHVTVRSAPDVSTAKCEQVDTVSVDQLGEYLGTCTDEEIAQINIALAISLDLGDMVRVEEKIVEKIVEVTAPPAEVKTLSDTAEIVKITTERDLYRELYEDLLRKTIGR